MGSRYWRTLPDADSLMKVRAVEELPDQFVEHGYIRSLRSMIGMGKDRLIKQMKRSADERPFGCIAYKKKSGADAERKRKQ